MTLLHKRARLWVGAIVVASSIYIMLLGFWQPSSISAAPPSVESFLISGRLAEGEAAMLAALKATPADDRARFGLGVIQVAQAVEHLAQSLYRYGLRDNSLTSILPILRLPVPQNPKPETLRYEDTRRVLQTWTEDLMKAAQTLETIKDASWTLPLRIGQIRLDLNSNGTPESNETLWQLFQSVSRIPVTPQQANSFTISFDLGDAIWLQGYCNLLSGMAETILAYDGREIFAHTAHLLFAKPETPYRFLVEGAPAFDLGGRLDLTDLIAFFHLIRFPLAEPQRTTIALTRFQKVLALSQQSWRAILLEKDNDREWLPNPKQTGVIPNVGVTQVMIDDWFGFLNEASALLEGQKLLPFWRSREARGVNLNKVFTQPQPLDMVLWLQGTAATPYLEFGKLTNEQVWQRLLTTFGGQFFGFAAWFN